MNCPLHNPEDFLLLEYSARKLDPESTALLERHLEGCPDCRRFAEEQRALWNSLDSWEAEPVSTDFDRRLYSRIENQVSWRDQLFTPFRRWFAWRGMPAAAAACVVLMAGLLLDPHGKPVPAPVQPDVSAVDVQPEQVENALDAMDVLSEFNRKARPEKSESKL